MTSESDTTDPSSSFWAIVASYVDDQIGVSELVVWLVDHVDWLIADQDDPARELAHIVEFHLSEMSVFRSSEDALHQSLTASLASNGLGSARSRERDGASVLQDYSATQLPAASKISARS